MLFPDFYRDFQCTLNQFDAREGAEKGERRVSRKTKTLVMLMISVYVFFYENVFFKIKKSIKLDQSSELSSNHPNGNVEN